MSTISITKSQLQQIQQVLAANPNDPAAVWAALSLMGDQYAAAAFQGLTDPSSFYGEVIQNSNLVSGVSGAKFNKIAINNVGGYVALLEQEVQDNKLNPDGTVPLPTTTAIESNGSLRHLNTAA